MWPQSEKLYSIKWNRTVRGTGGGESGPGCTMFVINWPEERLKKDDLFESVGSIQTCCVIY